MSENKDKNIIYVNNTIIQDNQDKFAELVNLLKNNVQFTNSLIPIWQLFQINLQGEIQKQDLKKYLTVVFQFLIYVLPRGHLEKLAEEECQRLLNNDQETISQDVFGEIFAYLACKWVENPSLDKAIGFIHKIFDRTTKLVIQDIRKQEQDIEVSFDIVVHLYSKNQIESQYSEELKEQFYSQNIYYEEIVQRNEQCINEAKQDCNKVIVRQIINFKQVIPLGYSSETFVTTLRNSNYDIKEEKITHQCAEFKFQGLKHVSAILKPSQEAVNDLKAYSEVEQIFQLIPVLYKHLQQDDSEVNEFTRINAIIARPVYFDYLKVKSTNQEKYLNIVSDFLTNQDMDVDEIYRLNKQTKEKLKRQKEANLNQEEVKKLIKKKPIDHDELKQRFNFQLLQNIQIFLNQEKLKQTLNFIKQQNEQQDTTGGTYELKFKNFTSKYESLPKDTLKTFSEDIIEYANRDPIQMLLLGKPKTGKTTFAKQFAKQIDIVHIEPLILIEKSLNRIKEFEENPPEMDDDGNPKEVLPPCDLKVKEYLENGQEVASETLLDLVNHELNNYLPKNKGFILDLPLNNRPYEFSWVDAIVRNKVQLPKLGCRYFSHIIEFEHSDEEVIQFMKDNMENPDNGKLFSQYDRDILRKPKKKLLEGEEEEEEEPAGDDEDEDAKKPQDEKDLAFLPGNELETIQELLNIYKNKTKRKIQEFHSHLSINQHIKIPAAGLNVDELVETAVQRLSDEVEVLRPLATKLEGGSEKDNLTIEGQKIYRQWSPWQQIDPVELLLKGRVIAGRGDLACDYAGRVFLFDSEENQDKFLKDPRKYISSPPKLPSTYNVAVIGPKLAGKKTYAKKIAEQYGWRLVDVQQFICEKLIEQRQIEQEQGHQPSNFDPRANDVHLSEPEWKEFSKGKELSTKDVWPIILHKLGCPLQKKPEGWGVEKKEDEEEDEKKEEEEKKKAAKKAAAAKKTKDLKKEGDDERPKTPPLEDLPLKEIIQQINEDGKTVKPVQGLVIVGQPMTEEQINILKYHNIPIDKVIALVDTSEEEPGKVLNSRPTFEENYNLEQEMGIITNAVTLLKETYQEENVKEIHIGGTIDEVYNRIRTQLDPFFIKADDEAFIRVQADVNAEEEDNIVYGEYGPYCPVTLKDEQWLIPGKFDNPEKGESIEAYAQGRRHIFFGEAEQTKFKENVSAYYQEGQKVEIPPPRIMLVGVRGSGLHTQLQKLQETYKIPIMDFKANLQAHLLNEKKIRRSDRLYNNVGFRPEQQEETGENDEDGNPIMKVVPDPEVEEENAEFDKKQHEVELTKRIFKNVRQLFINGNFFKPVPPEDETLINPDDESMMPIEAELMELLIESKKLPEVIFFLQVSEEEFMNRTYNTIEQSLKDEYWAKIEAEREEKRKRKEQAAAKRQQQIDEGVEEADLDPEEEEEPEDKEAIEEGLKEKLNAKKEELINQRNQDLEQLEALTAEFDNIGIPIISIQCNRSKDKVFDQIKYKIKPYLEQRQNILEKYQCFEIKRPVQEEDDEGKPPVDPLTFYEKSYNYRKSRYQDRNPISLIDVPRQIEYPLIYRNRIYYFSSREEINTIKQQPLKYLTKQTFPKDVKNRPSVFLIGKSKTGKSTIAKILEEKLQLVRIKPSNILEDFIEEHDYLLSSQAKEYQRCGKEVTDEMLVDLILKRINLADCVQNGWVLEGFPKTSKQAGLLAKRGLIPTNVFSLQLDNKTIKIRASEKKSNKFGYNEIILHTKLEKEQQNISEIENYYIQNFNNIRFLDSKLSKWGIFDQAKKSIYKSISQRQSFARSLVTDQPVQVSHMGFTPKEILYNLGSFKNISPVALKTDRLFKTNGIKNSNLVYFDRFIYILSNDQETQDFLKRPDLFLYQKIKNMNVAQNISIGDIVKSEKNIQLQQFCIVSLLNNKLEKSMLDILSFYRNNIYSFSSFRQRNIFNENPQRYMNVKLPDKLPVTFSKTNLVKKHAKKEKDCTAYLEHHLGEKVMRVLAQLGYKRLKYPTISCKETALKFIGISLKSLNPNKDEAYRKKYTEKLHTFLKHCQYAETINSESTRKSMCWSSDDQKDLEQLSTEKELEWAFDKEQKLHDGTWTQSDHQKFLEAQKKYRELNEKIEAQAATGEEVSVSQEDNDLIGYYKMLLGTKKRKSCIWEAWDQENLLKITEEFSLFMENLQAEDKDMFFKKFIR